MTQISMNSAQPYILQALLEMGPEKSHLPKDVIKKVISLMAGTSIDNDAEATKKACSACANGAFSLRQRGCAVAADRGWRITEVGISVASGKVPMPPMPSSTVVRVKNGISIPVTGETETKVAVHPVAPMVSAPVEVVPVVTPKVVPSDGTSDWTKDEDVLTLIVSNTRCFGSWSPNHPECGKCPLSNRCRDAQAVSIAFLAHQMKGQPDPVDEKVRNLHAEIANSVGPTKARTKIGDPNGVPLRSPRDGVCRRSGASYKTGDRVIYIRGEGIVREDAISTDKPAAEQPSN